MSRFTFIRTTILVGILIFVVFFSTNAVLNKRTDNSLASAIPQSKLAKADYQVEVDPAPITELQIKVLDQGDVTNESSTVKSTSSVSVYYRGWRAKDGFIFDNNLSSTPITFNLGSVIEGWQKGLLDMKVGEIRRIKIPARLAYKDQEKTRTKEDGTVEVTIPKNSDLIFDVELVDVK